MFRYYKVVSKWLKNFINKIKTFKSMEIINVEARYKEVFSLPEEFMQTLPKKLILFTTVQYFNSLNNIQKQLENQGIAVKLIKPRHTCYNGQILGCSNQEIIEEGDFLFIGDGLFHPKALLLKNTRTVYVFNPKTEESFVLTTKDVEGMKKKIWANYVKFLSSKKIGVLLTTKFGQYKPQLMESLKKDFPDKEFYFFLDNTYDFASLENFPFIDCFLNTMCERIGYDDSDVQGLSILNVEDLYSLNK